MSEESLSDLLERSADRHAVGALPLERMLMRSRAARRRRAGLMALAASVVVGSLIAGTTLLFRGSESPEQNVAGPPPSKDAVVLDGTWKVAEVLDEKGRSLLSGGYVGQVYMRFDAGKVSGNSGCNYFDGQYKQSGPDGRDLVFPNAMRSTLMACGEPPLTLRLLAVRRVSDRNGVLALRAEDGATIVKLEPVVPGRAQEDATVVPTASGLLGTWEVTSVDGGTPPADAVKEIRFSHLHGGFAVGWSDGLNDHSRRISLVRGSFHTGSGISTQIGCSGDRLLGETPCTHPSGFGVAEATALRLTNYGTLVFLGPSGENLATYERPDRR